eukprot:5017317-Prymnesium_polylepis.2
MGAVHAAQGLEAAQCARPTDTASAGQRARRSARARACAHVQRVGADRARAHLPAHAAVAILVHLPDHILDLGPLALVTQKLEVLRELVDVHLLRVRWSGRGGRGSAREARVGAAP